MKRGEKIFWGILIGGLLFACGFFLNGYLHPPITYPNSQIQQNQQEEQAQQVQQPTIYNNANNIVAPTTVLKPAFSSVKQTDDQIIVYVTNSGAKYHREGCQYLSRSCIQMTLSEAKQKGYTPCSKCNPPR